VIAVGKSNIGKGLSDFFSAWKTRIAENNLEILKKD
jgi:hypothetical protein